MALVLKDRVQEITNTTGTGTVTLAGAVTGFQTFAAVGDGNTTYYAITGGSQWELGIGTYTASGTTLSRDTVLSSSNNGNLVDFAAGSKTVFVTYPTSRVVIADGTSIAAANSSILPVTSGGTGSATASFSGANITTINASNISSGTIANARTTASSSNGASTIVARGASGEFSAGTITATFSGSGASVTSINAANISSGILAVARGGTNNAFFGVSGPATSEKTYTFPNENMAVGYRNLPAVGTKTGSYTLQTADVGKYVQVGSGGSITIPDATFAEGDAISIFNNTTGAITITCTITTAYIAGTDSDKASVSLATRGVATILFISSTVCVISGNVS